MASHSAPTSTTDLTSSHYHSHTYGHAHTHAPPSMRHASTTLSTLSPTSTRSPSLLSAPSPPPNPASHPQAQTPACASSGGLSQYEDLELGRKPSCSAPERKMANTDLEPGSGEKGGCSMCTDKNAQVPDLPIAAVWPPWRRRDGWSGWMGDTVTAQSLVLCLIIQAFSTGILDATTYLDFSTFASNQTGNTILLTVAIVRTSGHLLLLTGVSFVSFLGSALVFGHLGHFFGLRRRIWLLANVLFQILCLTLATIFLSPAGPSATRLRGKHEWAIIMLFAIMSGAQVASARQASVQEIPTAPMTSSYVDLVGDKYLFVGFTHKKAGARNRRLAYILAMISGSFIGGVMHMYAGSWVVVVVATGFKLGVVVLMGLAPAEGVREKK